MTSGRKGKATWLLGFLTLLATFNVFAAIFQLNLNGGDSTANFKIFDITLGSLDTELYFWASIVATFVFFTATSFSFHRGLPADPRVLQRLNKVEEDLTFNTNMLENTQIGFFRKLEENEKANEEIFRKISINVEDMKKETLGSLSKQEEALLTIEGENRKNIETIRKQATELTGLKKKIEQIGKEAPSQKAKLTGGTKLEKFKNVPPRLATKLNGIEITNVSEFLAADSDTMAEKTAESVERIARMQTEAQLLMVPGIDEKNAELLAKVGINSRRELADQDPVQLYRGIAGIAKTQVIQGKMTVRRVPTIEDVTSWIKQARL